MTRAPRASSATLFLITLSCAAFGSLTAVAVLALILMRLPARAEAAQLNAPRTEIQITAVPTVSHPATLLPETISDSFAPTNLRVEPATALPASEHSI
ncbi:MAG: hypothetical protein ABI835_15465, partial [Chloroflexota bacterium]